jgi:hypothetical protein
MYLTTGMFASSSLSLTTAVDEDRSVPCSAFLFSSTLESLYRETCQIISRYAIPISFNTSASAVPNSETKVLFPFNKKFERESIPSRLERYLRTLA